MKKLSNKFLIKGIGKGIIYSTIIEREGDIILSKRDDDVYEVFIVRTQQEKTISNVKLENKELAPKNEDFGTCAWCYLSEKDARHKYETLLKTNNF